MNRNQNRIRNIALRSRAAMTKEIQFVAAETDAPLATIQGENVQFLIENSELIKTIIEIGGQPNREVLVIPISGFPADRRVLFANILNGVPVGAEYADGAVNYYPLPPEEERDLQVAVNARAAGANEEIREALIQQERQKVILETMQYLLLPTQLIFEMLHFDVMSTFNSNSLNDTIEENVKTHKKWLYTTGQLARLNDKNRENLSEYFNEKKRVYNERLGRARKQHKQHSRYRTSSNNYNNSDDYMEYLDELHRQYQENTEPESFMPVSRETTGRMTPAEYEKYLRTVYYKRKNDSLPQQELHLNALFNENRRAEKTRANEQNNSKVIFYNPNKRTRKARKSAKRKSRKN